jgi:hypothetical protein
VGNVVSRNKNPIPTCVHVCTSYCHKPPSSSMTVRSLVALDHVPLVCIAQFMHLETVRIVYPCNIVC